MADKDIRCIIKCVISFQDGNCKPPEVKKGEVLDVSEDEFHKLSKSGPKHFELIERRFLEPKVVPEEVAEELVLHTETDGMGPVDEDDEIEEWKPVGWYAAQLAKEPKDEEA